MKFLPAGLSIGLLVLTTVFTLGLMFVGSSRSPIVQLNVDISGLGPRQECVSNFHISVDGKDQIVTAQKKLTTINLPLSRGAHRFAVTAAHDFTSQPDGMTSRGIYAQVFEMIVEGDQYLTIYFNSPLVANPEAMSEICSK